MSETHRQRDGLFPPECACRLPWPCPEARAETWKDCTEKVVAARDELRAEVARLRRELLCRDDLIKDHLAKILHLENRVDTEAHRGDKAGAALRYIAQGGYAGASWVAQQALDGKWQAPAEQPEAGEQLPDPRMKPMCSGGITGKGGEV